MCIFKVCESYKHVIFKFLPHLLYLDNTKLLEKDRKIIDDPEAGLNRAALIFTCHRIIGLPSPIKEKGITQTIHVEVILPLMEEITDEPEVEDIVEEIIIENKPGKQTNKKGKGKKGKGGKNLPYAAPDEYAQEIKAKIKDTSFKTEKVSWSKVIQFPENAIIVEAPDNDFKAIRDTFRSIIKVKVVYLETGMEDHYKKAGKGGKKGKDKKRKDKKNKGKQAATSSATTSEEVEHAKPQEVILKKVTLAKFDCELHDINWSDKTIDFYWADHPDANPNAIRVEGSLRAIQYIGETAAGGTKQGDDVGKKKSALPNLFTCQYVLVALVVVLAVASASVAPLAYSVASPVAYTGAYPYAYPYAAAYAAPYAAPLAYSVAAPVAVGGTGYVAATRGSVHTAPLPEGPFASSLHINTAPAPGTF
ncbi:cuticle protein [Holotrichia oblita]|uniref:Cuticle protein n=1 Tax=Holotrichia oblita TaxID=644536 RepID=A0ACB9TH86_HOLOL|nr:cuticle protein [Holotrichia oblita]